MAQVSILRPGFLLTNRSQPQSYAASLSLSLSRVLLYRTRGLGIWNRCSGGSRRRISFAKKVHSVVRVCAGGRVRLGRSGCSTRLLVSTMTWQKYSNQEIVWCQLTRDLRSPRSRTTTTELILTLLIYRGWKLTLEGLASGVSLSLDIRKLMNRFLMHDQITRLVCVEGCSAIARWAGLRPTLSLLTWRRRAIRRRCLSHT